MCYGGWDVWVHGDSILICYVYVNIVGFTVPYYVCRNYMYIYNLNVYIYIYIHPECNANTKMWYCSYSRYNNLFNMLLYLLL